MIKYLYLLIILSCCVIFFVSAKVRMKKIDNLIDLREASGINSMLKSNFNFSSGLLLLIILITLSYVFLPEGFNYFLPFGFMKAKLFAYIGGFFLKLSFIWMIVSSIETSRFLDSGLGFLPVKRIYRTERLMLIGVILLSTGIFFTMASAITFALLATSFVGLKFTKYSAV